MSRSSSRALVVLALAWIAGCGSPASPDGGAPIDAGRDARVDAAPGEDAGPGDDAGPSDDAGPTDDADVDGGPIDAGPIESDGGPIDVDAGTDGGPVDVDGGPVGTDAGPVCGDGTATGTEECDGTDLAGETCASQGFGGGTLGCSSSCTLDTSACTPCGNGAIDAGEECDGTALGGETCASQGFGGGTLGCSSSCTLDTSACTPCGNGTIDAGEECDGTALGGATCASEGFDGGALSCSASCTLVTSACYRCGDGARNGTEQCDGASLGGATCASQGFDGGALGCTATCTYDTSACVDCGDGAIGGTEQCDGANLGGATCASRGFTAGTLACTAACAFDTAGCTTCGNGVRETGEACDGTALGGATCATQPGFASGPLACTTGCALDTSGCRTAATPSTAGQIVISEIMQNPATYADTDSEWFEVYNASAAALNLYGCRFTGTGSASDTFLVDANVVIAPGGYATFAVTTAMSGPPGFTPTYSYPRGGFALANSSDGISLDCGGAVIDTVVYDGGPSFPSPNGASMTLSPLYLDATANDLGARWCTGTSTIGTTTDLGTPGAPNDACPIVAIGFCRLQFPTTITGVTGGSTQVFGRVYSAGLTDLTGTNDPSAALVAQVGYGPDGSDPSTATGWTWITGAPNAGYGPASPGYEMNNDEYVATLTHPAAGTYDFAYRFSGDRGATWTYCDGGASGSSDGYQAANAGALTTTAPTSTANLYFSEYVEGMSNNKALEIYNAGTDPMDLSTCSIRSYINGATTATSLALSGSLAPGAVFVVCNNATVASVTCDLRSTSTVMGFNGDDALELVCAGTTMDIIGQIGTDPGTEWGTGSLSTADNTIRRACTVTAGDTNGTDAFTVPSTDWVGFAVDTFGGLGSRGCP